MSTRLSDIPSALDEVHEIDLHQIVADLHRIRARWRSIQGRSVEGGPREFPSRELVGDVVRLICEALFPMRLGPSDLRRESEDYFVGHALYSATTALVEQVWLELSAQHAPCDIAAVRARALAIVREFAAGLPRLRTLLDEDVLAAFRSDPAARSVDEVLICYPGLRALMHHRIAHELHRLGVPIIARMVSELAHSATGIDIHPGARIGGSLFIDHGTGVVIGSTAVIGERVRIYQAVTLGAKRIPVGQHSTSIGREQRHPTVEDDVVIYAGATVLGPITIGRGSVIGGNVWLTRSVPPGSQVTQAMLRRRSVREAEATAPISLAAAPPASAVSTTQAVTTEETPP